MAHSALFAVLLLSVTLTLCQGQRHDATLEEGAKGPAVVAAVLEKIRSGCVYSEDRLFLSRLAKAASDDGQKQWTYRPRYHGGIWQISEANFSTIRNCGNGFIKDACNNMRANLNIDWPSVTWKDLRKPLYSGLAAALYTLKTLSDSSMPGSIESQANIWAHMYSRGRKKFIDAALQPGKFDCKELDLVFVLDSSGSVLMNDFILMKNFTADVVDKMEISNSGVHVADIIYGTNVTLEFDFDDFQNSNQVKSALKQAKKLGGSTKTFSALDMAADTLYDSSLGARPQAKKVAVLVTDGKSNNFTATIEAGNRLKALGTTVFAVGVGSYRLDELRGVASEPICSHVLTLRTFSDIQSITTEIQKSTCNAPARLTKDKPLERDLPLQGQDEIDVVADIPDVNDIIDVDVQCGVLNMYVSVDFSKPSSAVYDFHFQVTASVSLPVTTDLQQMLGKRHVYLSVVASRLPLVATGNTACSQYKWTLRIVPKKDLAVTCSSNGLPVPCTETLIKQAGFCANSAPLPFDNPCTLVNLQNGALLHKHPYDPTKFIQCDMVGNAYVTSCPGNKCFNEKTLACGFTSPPSPPFSGSDGSQQGNLPATVHNPCTAVALSNRNLYHSYPGDSSKFIQCDAWGHAFVQSCGAGTEWSDQEDTCIRHTARTTTAHVPNCSSDGLYANPCDHHTYYVCSNGVAQKMDCAGSLYFNPAKGYCDYFSPSTAIPADCP